MTRNVKRSRSKPPVSVVNVVAFDKDARSQLPLRGKRRPPNDVHDKVLVMDIVSGGANALAKGALLFLSALMVYTAVPVNNYSNEKVSLSSKAVKLHIPSGLDEGRRRELSLSLGGGDCLWQVRNNWLIEDAMYLCLNISLILLLIPLLCSLRFKRCQQP